MWDRKGKGNGRGKRGKEEIRNRGENGTGREKREEKGNKGKER